MDFEYRAFSQLTGFKDTWLKRYEINCFLRNCTDFKKYAKTRDIIFENTNNGNAYKNNFQSALPQ